jgi:DNA-binding transcriptional regulator YdaS (Cro superfamily)
MAKRINPRERLQAFVRSQGSQVRAAEVLGIHQGNLSEMLSGRREVAARVLVKLGIERVFVQSGK